MGEGYHHLTDQSAAYWRGLSAARIPSSLYLSPLLFEHLRPGARIVDVGCAPGRTMRWLAAVGYPHLVGVDINIKAMREQTAQPASSARSSTHEGTPAHLSFVAADSRGLPFVANSFDCALTQAFWTTIADPASRQTIMREIGRILKPGGILYLADFARNWQIPLYRARYEAGMQRHYEPGTFEVKDSQSGELLYLAHHYTTEELTTLLSQGNLAVVAHEQPTLTTRSGNAVQGHIIVARKTGLSEQLCRNRLPVRSVKNAYT